MSAKQKLGLVTNVESWTWNENLLTIFEIHQESEYCSNIFPSQLSFSYLAQGLYKYALQII